MERSFFFFLFAIFNATAISGQIIFSLAPNISFGDDAKSNSVAFADVNLDGYPDLLIAGDDSNYDPIAHLYLNDGMGGFTLVLDTPFDDVRCSAVAFSDVDMDGDPDVLITGERELFLYIAKLYINDGAGHFTFVPNTPFYGVCCGSVTFSDIDLDGDPDVLITGKSLYGGIAKLYINDGLGGFTLSPNTPFPGVKYGSATFVDVDIDGYPDVLITGADNTDQQIAKLYENNGAGGFLLVPNTPFIGVKWSSVDFADVDMDGDPDALIAGSNNGDDVLVEFYANDGEGGFTLVPDMPFSGSMLYASVAFSDINLDGYPDVLVAKYNSTCIYQNNSGVFEFVEGMPFSSIFSTSIAFSDIDLDGDSDLLLLGYEYGESVGNIYINSSMLSALDSKWQKQSLHVCPNPTRGLLFIPDAHSIEVMVFDIKGLCVLRRKVFDGQIDLSSLSKGVYIVFAKFDEGSLQSAVVVRD